MTLTATRAPAAATRAERLLVPATFVTSLGNGIQLVATAVLVVTTGHSALSVGWLFIAVSVPPALLSLYFGRIADRFDRRTLCLAADLASSLAALALPVWLLLGGDPTRTAYLVSFALATVSALFMPASNALVKERIPAARIGRFTAHSEVALQTGTLFAATVGGFLIQFVGTTPLFAFNAVTFAGSALCLYLIGRAPGRPAAPAEAPRTQASARPPLVRLGLLYAAGAVLPMVSNTLLVVMVYQEFHRGAAVYGVVDALAGAGFLVAATLYPRIRRRHGRLGIALAGLLACDLLAAAQPFHLWALLGTIPVAGLCCGLARVAIRDLLLTAVPEEAAGRVFGALNAVGLGLSAAVTVLVATIADRAWVGYGVFTLAALTGGAAVVAAGGLRRAREELG